MDLLKRRVIAHRGASALVRFENTIEAFEKAIEIGAEAMEFDVRITKDGMMVSYHDDSIEGEKLKDLTYEQLQNIAKRKGFSVPTVEEILIISKDRILLDIELKEAGYEKELIELVKRYLNYEQYVMKSFLDHVIMEIKTIDRNIKTGLLLGLSEPLRAILTRSSELFPEARIVRTKPDFISPNSKLLRCAFIYRMKMYRLPIFVWTVNDEDQMKKLFTKGIHAIITDRPDIGLKVMNDYGKG